MTLLEQHYYCFKIKYFLKLITLLDKRNPEISFGVIIFVFLLSDDEQCQFTNHENLKSFDDAILGRITKGKFSVRIRLHF